MNLLSHALKVILRFPIESLDLKLDFGELTSKLRDLIVALRHLIADKLPLHLRELFAPVLQVVQRLVWEGSTERREALHDSILNLHVCGEECPVDVADVKGLPLHLQCALQGRL